MDSKQFRISEMVMDGAFALNFQFSIDEMVKHLKPKLKLPLMKCKSIVEQAIRRGVEDELYVVNEDRLCISLPLVCSFTNINDKKLSGKNRYKLPSRQKKRNGLISTKVKRGVFRSGENVGGRKSANSLQEKQHKARRVRVRQERLKKRNSVNHSTRLKSSMKECSLPAKQRKESSIHTLNKPQSMISIHSKISSNKEISEVTLPLQMSIKNENLLDDSMNELINTPMHFEDDQLSNQYGPILTQEWEQHNVTV